jgi:hypothetical protein
MHGHSRILYKLNIVTVVRVINGKYAYRGVVLPYIGPCNLFNMPWLRQMTLDDHFSEEQDTIPMIQKYVSDASDRLYIHQIRCVITTLDTYIPAQRGVSVYELQSTE